MKFNHQNIPVDTALSKHVLDENGFSFLWIQEDSRTGFFSAEDSDVSMEHLIEARAFGGGKELHVFEGIDGRLKAVLTIEEDDGEDNWYDETVLLRSNFGRKLTIRHLISYDEDGLAYSAETVFEDYKSGKEV